MKGMRIPTQTEDIYYINEKGRTGKTVFSSYEVLEKVRAELIKYLSDYDFGTGYQNDVAMIIDKYIEGSESE